MRPAVLVLALALAACGAAGDYGDSESRALNQAAADTDINAVAEAPASNSQ